MAAGAESDQQFAIIDAGFAVMYMKAVGRTAAAAEVLIAVQDFVAEPGEAISGVSSGAVAGAAKASDPRKITTTFTEQARLLWAA